MGQEIPIDSQYQRQKETISPSEENIVGLEGYEENRQTRLHSSWTPGAYGPNENSEPFY
jgi:hypothetical protein